MKKDYNSIPFKNSAIDKISSCCGGNGGGGDPDKEDKFGNRAGGELHYMSSKFVFDNTSKTRKGKNKTKSKATTQISSTDLHRGDVFYLTNKSKTVSTDKGKGKFKDGYNKSKTKQVAYYLPEEGRGTRSVMTNRGRGSNYRHRTLTKGRTRRLRNKFSMGKGINP